MSAASSKEFGVAHARGDVVAQSNSRVMKIPARSYRIWIVRSITSLRLDGGFAGTNAPFGSCSRAEKANAPCAHGTRVISRDIAILW